MDALEDYTRARIRSGHLTEAELDEFLREHDHKVITDWEMRHGKVQVLIENINGEPAAEWLHAHNEKVRAEAWDEGARRRTQDGFIRRNLAETLAANPHRSAS